MGVHGSGITTTATSPFSARESALESKLRTKLRAAAYAQGGIDWEKLFHHYDRDNKGTLDYVEFRSAVRRDGKMNATTLHDKDLQLIFQKVDYDESGEIDLQEFTAWLHASKGYSAGDEVTEGRQWGGVHTREVSKITKAKESCVYGKAL